MNKIILCLVVMVCVLGCGKKPVAEPKPVLSNTSNPATIDTPVTKYGEAIFHLHTYIGVEEIYGYGNASLPQQAERKMIIELAQVYLSDFELIRANGTVQKIGDTVFLKQIDKVSYHLPPVPVGKYKSVRFKVGLDSVCASKPVATAWNQRLNRPEMWFGTSPEPKKYMIARFIGNIDTSSVPNETVTRQPYEFQLGGSYRTLQIELPERAPARMYNVTENSTEYIHMYMDVSVLFSGLDLRNPASLSRTGYIHSPDILYDKIGKNITNMFRYEE